MTDQRLHFAYYCTGHGLGHATRVIEVSRHLLDAGHAVTIVSNAALARHTCHLPQEHFALRDKLLDCGSKQADAFTVDMRASLELYYKTAVERREELLDAEAAWLSAAGVHVVVSDTVPLACAAAHAAQLPCAVVTNFSWDFIYSQYATETGSSFQPMVWQIAEDLSRANVLLRLPGYTPMPAFRAVEDIPLIARMPRRSRAEVRRELGLGQEERVVLLMYGGQPAGAWQLRAQALPTGWRCVACSGGQPLGTGPLPDNFILADADAYTPDLIEACDVVLGKIGYGTTSEVLATNTPLVTVRRSHFNEEPFLRALLQLHSAAVEMRRRDFLSGNWAAHIMRASELKPTYRQADLDMPTTHEPTNGAEVAAQRLVALAKDSSSGHGGTTGLDHAGSIRLRDSIVWGYCMQRATRRKPMAPAVPKWFTAGKLPDLEEGAAAEEADESTSSDDEPVPVAQPQHDFDITEGTLHGGSYPDTLAFLRSLASLNTADLTTASGNSLDAADREAAVDLFDWQDDIVVARAPGRLDVMGGIADYSGSLVLQLPLAEACHVAAQLRSGPAGEAELLRIVSLDGRGTDRAPSFEMPLAELLPGGQPLPLVEARAMFADDTARNWAAYVAGTLLVLMHECDARVPPRTSLSALVASDVPPGAGVSSSAALEVTSMAAFAAVLQLDIPPRQLAILCQKAENWVVGAPCGVMDQMTAALGRRRRLLALSCRPAHLLPSVAIPDNLRFWGVDSGIRHSVGGADYGTVRAAAFMGLALMSAREAAAHPRPPSLDGRAADPADMPLIGGGYACAIAPSLFEQAHSDALPSSLSGADFLSAHGCHLDPPTTVQPDTRYPVRQCVAHPIYDNFRVEAFRTMLQGHPTDTAALLNLGELMFQSHASYGRCGLGSKGTDLLVDLTRREIMEASARDEQPAVFGAKITGGGSGGTVCILGRADDSGQAAVDRIVAAYQDATSHKPRVFTGSSSGSAAFGHLRVRRLSR